MSGKCFLWRPYITAGTNPLIRKLYGELENWILVSPCLVEVVESFAKCVWVSELVELNCMEQYFPHRVSMQFGMDQDVPRKVMFRSNGNPKIAWENYTRPIFYAKLYVPSRCFHSCVTTQYFEWWKKSDRTRSVVKISSQMRRDNGKYVSFHSSRLSS
ncbi:hypothetical protein Vadar_033199 [Vaccinium darrowii]|uniref:Uncharacterized protein n=1 Tax=Vaccinium darrowii TaxID=229202 RepID=A0ACB7YAT0_9ERIC|nr:hypothetical protein Vadar_033199 [Vaccinium darrowii]